jgi:cell division protease FtsH
MMGGHDEREQTLNQILTEMDGFDPRTGVIVLAATNRPDILDPALLRPGRFDRRVAVNPPDRDGRAAILKAHTRGVPLAENVDLDQIAAQTPGMVGADLRNLVNEAALTAARHEHEQVEPADFTEALSRIILGSERRIMLSPEERERTRITRRGTPSSGGSNRAPTRCGRCRSSPAGARSGSPSRVPMLSATATTWPICAAG